MNAPRITSAHLAGGYAIDADLPLPDDDCSWDDPLGGLHVLRHVDRYLRSIDKHLVIVGSDYSDALFQFIHDSGGPAASAELDRYRRVETPDSLRRILRNEPDAVPFLNLLGGGCTGWREPVWSGVRLDRSFSPGRLFLLHVHKVPMMAPRPKVRRKPTIHLMEWQSPFPPQSLATWTSYAKLSPDRHDVADVADVAFMFHFGHNFSYAPEHRRACDEWWRTFHQRPALSVVR
ncbi:MAG: hypothetical protein WCI22_18395 [Actinomycetota bacterium]